jgi:cytochrome c biogenesis protein CcmG/thiol:disulfide interchange protein DsbE
MTDSKENAPMTNPINIQPGRPYVRFFAFTLVVGLLTFLAFGLVKAGKGQVISGPAPDFSLIGFDGKKVTLSELRGKVVVINFWASWCIPCRQEAAYLERTWRKYKDKDVVFIGVDYVDTEKEARAYIKEFDITYINGPDLKTRIADLYNIKGVPETFYINRNGILEGIHIGPLESPLLDNKIDELLAEPYSAITP